MATMTQSEFARQIGKSRQYVSQAKERGLLVMDGDKVNAEASLARMEALKDPNKQGVADLHAENRQQKQAAASATPPGDALALSAGEKAGSVYQQSRALKEKYAAMSAKRDYEIATGKLIVAEDAARVVANAAAVVRLRLESLPDVLAPQFAAETDEQRIRAAFHDHIETLLGEMSRQFLKLAKEHE